MTNKLVPILYVTNAYDATKWYSQIGFTLESEHQFAPDMPIYAFLKCGDSQLHLSEHKGDAKPETLVYFYIEDVDDIAQEFGETVKEQPWGT